MRAWARCSHEVLIVIGTWLGFADVSGESRGIGAIRGSHERLTPGQIENRTDLTRPEVRVALRNLREAGRIVETEGRYEST